MRYRYFDDFRRGISVFVIFSYGIAVLGTPQCPPPLGGLLCSTTVLCKRIVFAMNASEKDVIFSAKYHL